MAPFVNAGELDALTGEVKIADVRSYLDGRDGREAYIAGHIPGAVFVDLDSDLSTDRLPATEGRHPLPQPDDFAAAMTRLGIGEHTTVVAYDDTGGLTAGRLVVMLRMLGHDAAVLGGGIASWVGPLDIGHPAPSPAAEPFVATPWPAERLASAGDLTGGTSVAIDARDAARFSGARTFIDNRAGHIPGARSAPGTEVLDGGRIRGAAELRAHYARLGIDESTDVIAYCGSGVSACLNVLALERAGLPTPRLYVASWSGWSADPQNPAELGA